MGGDAAEDGGLAAFCVRQSSLGRLGIKQAKKRWAHSSRSETSGVASCRGLASTVIAGVDGEERTRGDG